MRYQQYAPSRLLSRYVECFWSLESSSDDVCLQQRIVADGRAEIILHLGEPASMVVGGRLRKQSRVFLAGQITRPLLLIPSATQCVVGIRLRPAAAAGWLKAPMSEFTNEMPSIEDMPPHLRSALNCCDTDIPKIAIEQLDLALSDCTLKTQASPRMDRAVGLILQECGAVRVERLAAEINLSRRQLERQFLRDVGLGPKTFGRIIRFQNVFQAYESERDWVAVAHDCGYYDQAHLIQDFRELAGETPAKLLERESDLARVFLQTSHFSKTGFARSN